MEITDKYPLLEQSKRIAELLGENAPESEALWQQYNFDDSTQWRLIPLYKYSAERKAIPAYDLAELGEMIVQINDFDPHIMSHVVRSTVGSNNPLPWKFVTMGKAAELFPTEAQARAALLIYLLEHK